MFDEVGSTIYTKFYFYSLILKRNARKRAFLFCFAAVKLSFLPFYR